jgi:rhamnosyltransferase
MSRVHTRASVVVRTFNSASTLSACLESLRSQTVRAQLIVVDSGSRDETVAIAERMADRIVELRSVPFSYGRALNRGASVAEAPVHFAVSSHCVIPRRDWIELALRHYELPDVAATNGQQTLPDGSPLTDVFHLRGSSALPNPLWGFSNHASSWRADIWREEPFDETLVASEDFEWSDRVLARGFAIVFDPALTVPGHHRTAQGPRALYHRSYREFLGTAACRPLEAPTVRRAVREWWTEHPPDTKPHRQRLSPYRIAVIGGRYMAGRALAKSDVESASANG